ncbi:hypothetical protein GCM10025859_43840 [Alicyclobacillus fastidiosus]|nr:hypothetical protein GCM10025859_43840 [Alicyclobacillus fastidiosus]
MDEVVLEGRIVRLEPMAKHHQRATERIGGVREGVLRKHRVLPNGFIRDSVYFSIVDDEWPSVKKRLESYLIS